MSSSFSGDEDYATLAHPVKSVLIAQIKLRGIYTHKYVKICQNGRAYYFKGIKLCCLIAKINMRFHPDASRWYINKATNCRGGIIGDAKVCTESRCFI